MTKIFAETERLILREITDEDVDGMFALDSDPEVHRYLENKPITTKDEASKIIAYIRQQYEENGLGRWAVIMKDSGAFAGWTGLKLETIPTNGFTRYYDLGYRLLRKYWGLGIGTESARASVEYGFETLNLQTIYGAAHAENIGSNAIFHKLKFTQVNPFDYEGEPHWWYSMSKEQYQKLAPL